MSVSTGLIYSAEHEVNPQIPDYFTALYFGLTTLTTVGFGDISPVTVSGRFVVMASILAGVAIIPAQAANLAEAYLDFMKERSSAASSTMTTAAGRMAKKTIVTSASAATNADTTLFSVERIKEDTVTTTTDEMRRKVDDCTLCGAKSHRDDARFCWSCGYQLSKSTCTLNVVDG